MMGGGSGGGDGAGGEERRETRRGMIHCPGEAMRGGDAFFRTDTESSAGGNLSQAHWNTGTTLVWKHAVLNRLSTEMGAPRRE